MGSGVHVGGLALNRSIQSGAKVSRISGCKTLAVFIVVRLWKYTFLVLSEGGNAIINWKTQTEEEVLQV